MVFICFSWRHMQGGDVCWWSREKAAQPMPSSRFTAYAELQTGTERDRSRFIGVVTSYYMLK